MKRFLFYSAYLSLFICSVITIFVWPHRFQKWNSIKPRTDFHGISRQLVPDKALDVRHFIESIPYQMNAQFIYAVLPETKYRKTIIEGHGDCSNLSFGAAYYLLTQNMDFEIIHFLPPNSFLKGGGHVALRVPYILNDGIKRIGVVDLAEGGIPQCDGTSIDISELGKCSSRISILRLPHDKSSFSQYYGKEYLNRVFIGRTPSTDVVRYFRFIEAVHIEVGSEKLEKLIFDGLAVLLGFYYPIYVAPDFFRGHKVEHAFFVAILWLIRITLVLLPAGVLYELGRRWKKRIVPKGFRNNMCVCLFIVHVPL
ncbi:MAG: hypothetical protein U5R49_10075 [Deltaproteobacteria bacterium]|nr:hypothetical protein [Deltaproteobacteria bacterium]